jgi:hypothetical protein
MNERHRSQIGSANQPLTMPARHCPPDLTLHFVRIKQFCPKILISQYSVHCTLGICGMHAACLRQLKSQEGTLT